MKPNVKSIIVLLPLLLIFEGRNTYACEPVLSRHPFRDSKAGFFGELVSIIDSSERCERTLRFKVERYWKGKLLEYVDVQTATVYCCGYNFEAGGKYLVYAYAETGTPLGTSVGWVFAADSAHENLKKLGKGKSIQTKQVP